MASSWAGKSKTFCVPYRKRTGMLAGVNFQHWEQRQYSGNNLTGVAVQFAEQNRKNATQAQRCIAIFNIKYAITFYF